MHGRCQSILGHMPQTVSTPVPILHMAQGQSRTLPACQIHHLWCPLWVVWDTSCMQYLLQFSMCASMGVSSLTPSLPFPLPHTSMQDPVPTLASPGFFHMRHPLWHLCSMWSPPWISWSMCCMWLISWTGWNSHHGHWIWHVEGHLHCSSGLCTGLYPSSRPQGQMSLTTLSYLAHSSCRHPSSVPQFCPSLEY